MFIRVNDVTYVETQSNYSKLCSFISSGKMVKNTIKLCIRIFLLEAAALLLFFIKSAKRNAKKGRGKIFSTFAGMTSLTSKWKLRNFVTLRKLIKTPGNFLQDSYSEILVKFFPHVFSQWWSFTLNSSWKVPKNGVYSGPYFPALLRITPYSVRISPYSVQMQGNDFQIQFYLDQSI